MAMTMQMRTLAPSTHGVLARTPLRPQHLCQSRRRGEAAALQWDIHGRHIEVTESMKQKIRTRLEPIIKEMETPEFLEAVGGVGAIDVKLMNTSAEIHVKPVRLDKELHDTYLRMGELKAISTGCDSASDCFEAAVQQLESKLKRQTKAEPKKVDYRKSFGGTAGQR